MKKSILFFALTGLFCCGISFAQIRVNNDNSIQLGYETGAPVLIGENTPANPNGRWAIDASSGYLSFYPTDPNWNFYYNPMYLSETDGHIGIGIFPDYSYLLDVYGSIRAARFETSSDGRLKRDIQDIEGSLDKIKLLNGKSYIKTTPPIGNIDSLLAIETNEIKRNALLNLAKKPIDEIKEMGFIAQDLKAVFPDLVSIDNKGYQSINYIALIPVLVEAIKEQQIQIEELKKKINN